MGRGPILSRAKRVVIVDFHRDGISQSRIALLVRCGQSTISDTLRRVEETGGYVDRPRSGRHRISTPRDDQYLCHLARRWRMVTARMVQTTWQPILRRWVSVQTIRNRSVDFEKSVHFT